MRGNAGFVALGERSTALDVLYGIAPGSVGSLARTCLDNLKNFDPTESAKSCLVIKEIPSRSISSNTANPVALTTQTQNFLGAYTNENNEFVPQDGPGNNRGTGAWIKQVSGSTEQNFESATVTTGSSKDRAFPIYKVVVALRNSAGVVAAVPDQTFNRVEADIGLEQTLSVKFAPDVTRCDPESLETQINETNTAKKAAEEARDALFPPNSKPREMSEYLDDVFSAVQKAVDPNNGQGNPGQGNPGQGNPGQGGPGQSDPAQPHNKLDSPDLAKWYSDNSSGHHLTTTSDLATVVKYVQDHIDTSFGPSGKELKGYLSESDYKLAAYGCTTCTPVEKAFQDFFKRVHFEALKQLASKYDKKAKDLAVQDTYIKNPFTVELTVKPQLVDSDKGGQEVQPNMAKLGVVMRNVESWKACGKDGDFTPDISLIGYELGYDGSKIESSGRQAHPLWSNVNRLYWKFNTTGDKLDLQNSATLSSSFQAMNPNFPRAPSGSDPGTPSSPGTPPSETRNYAAERRACEDVGDYRFGNVGQEDFDLLAQVAWHFSDDGDTDTNLIVENNTVDTLVHPDVKGDYSWPIHTGLTSITVKDTADILVGNYVTQTMKIEDRSTPLMIVATVLTKKLTIHPNALKAGITWIAPQDDAALPVLTRAVLGRGMNCSVLKNAASIAGAPLWHPNLKLMSSNNSDISARMAMSCTLASFAPKMGEAFSSTNGSPPMTPNLTTAVSRMDMNQYFKGAWGIKPVAEDQSEVWY